MGTDIVYVWINAGPFAPDDLKYSLRSVEQNWVGNFRVSIVGDRHPGLKEFWHIPHTRMEDPHLPKALDSVRKMEAIINTPYIQEGFVYMYDDTYLLRPMDQMYIRQRVALREIPADWSVLGTNRKHQLQLYETVKALRQHGFKRVWDYETHTPRWYEKRKMQEVIDTYRPAGNRLLLATLYYNHHYKHQEPRLLRPNDECKVVFAGRRTDGVPPAPTTNPMMAMEHYRSHIGTNHFWNHKDGGISDVGLQYLRHSLWPEPSSFEAPASRIIPNLTIA